MIVIGSIGAMLDWDMNIHDSDVIRLSAMTLYENVQKSNSALADNLVTSHMNIIHVSIQPSTNATDRDHRGKNWTTQCSAGIGTNRVTKWRKIPYFLPFLRTQTEDSMREDLKQINYYYLGVSISFDVIKLDFGRPVRKYTSSMSRFFISKEFACFKARWRE